MQKILLIFSTSLIDKKNTAHCSKKVSNHKITESISNPIDYSAIHKINENYNSDNNCAPFVSL